jgi:hypothetical protein
MNQKAWSELLAHCIGRRDLECLAESHGDQGDLDAPVKVTASPRFADKVGALLSLLQGDRPPIVQLQSCSLVPVVFGFGDVSGTGLGSTFTCGTGFTFRIVVWRSFLEKDESSNWKECTVVEMLEEEAEGGMLENLEGFTFTDKATVESCAYKGSSSCPKLLSLIIQLKAMSTRLGIRLHIFHVDGTRMIAQGTDGVSQRYLGQQGVMAGEAMKAFILIHQLAVDRSSELLAWLQSWIGEKSLLLTTEGWFQQGNDIEGWGQMGFQLF